MLLTRDWSKICNFVNEKEQKILKKCNKINSFDPEKNMFKLKKSFFVDLFKLK